MPLGHSFILLNSQDPDSPIEEPPLRDAVRAAAPHVVGDQGYRPRTPHARGLALSKLRKLDQAEVEHLAGNDSYSDHHDVRVL